MSEISPYIIILHTLVLYSMVHGSEIGHLVYNESYHHISYIYYIVVHIVYIVYIHIYYIIYIYIILYIIIIYYTHIYIHI